MIGSILNLEKLRLNYKFSLPLHDKERLSPILQDSSLKMLLNMGGSPVTIKVSAGFNEPSLLPLPTT